MLYADGIYIVPQADGTASVGSTSEREFEHPQTVDGRLDEVIGRARALCPDLSGAEVVERWAGVRPRAPRRDPMLGPVPGLPGVFAALGAFKIGFGIAPKVGEVLAAAVEGHPLEMPETFSVAHHLLGRADA